MDVRAAARHVGRNRDRAWHAGIGDDMRFPFVMSRVQHFVLHLPLDQQGRQFFRLLDAYRSDQDGLAPSVTLGDLFEDRVVFLGLCPVNLVVFVQPNHRHVRRHVDDFETVNLGEFCSLRHGGARHAGQFRVEAKIVLEGDRGEGLILCLHFDAFFGFQRLVNPSEYRRPSIMRPVNSSMMTTLPSLTM